ncbi:MAG: insulinase family protein, partial [Lentisphaeria bacterium]
LLPAAFSYISFLDSYEYSNSFLHDTFYKIGCEFSIKCDTLFSYISINGLHDNQNQAIQTLFKFFASLKHHPNTLSNLQKRLSQSIHDSAKNQEYLFNKALINYAKFGPDNPITSSINLNDIANLDGHKLIRSFQQISTLSPDILYYGPSSFNSVSSQFKNAWSNFRSDSNNSISQIHSDLLPAFSIPSPKKFPELNNENQIIFLNFPGLQQTQIAFLHKAEPFNPNNVAIRRIFNHYFGMSMSSIVFQQIREAQALAYTAYSYYSSPEHPHNSHFFVAYAATQPQKSLTAIESFKKLFNNVPLNQQRLNISINAITNQIRTTRYHGMKLLEYVDSLAYMRLNEDINKIIFQNIQYISLNDLANFIELNISNKQNSLIIMGDKNMLNLNQIINSTLSPLNELSLPQILP